MLTSKQDNRTGQDMTLVGKTGYWRCVSFAVKTSK